MKPMLQMNGQVIHVFVSPKGVSKKTGDEYGGDDKVQIMGNIPMDNGQSRKELVTLKTEEGKTFEGMIGQEVSFPVSTYSVGKAVGYYIPKGHKIVPRKPQ